MGNPPRFTSGGNPPCVRSHASTLQKPRFTPQESYLLVLGATPPRFRSLAPRLRSHTSSLPEPSLHVTLDWGQQTHTPPDLQITFSVPFKLPPHLEIHLYGCSGSEHIWQRDKEEESIDAYQVPMRRGTKPRHGPWVSKGQPWTMAALLDKECHSGSIPEGSLR